MKIISIEPMKWRTITQVPSCFVCNSEPITTKLIGERFGVRLQVLCCDTCKVKDGNQIYQELAYGQSSE